MRVLHLPCIICNQPWEMSRGLRKIGIESDYMIWDDNNASWLLPGPPDYNLNIYHRDPNYSLEKIRRDLKLFLLKSLFKYDVFHYHSNYSLFDYDDLKILKKFKKKIVLSHWGCDIRLKSIEINRKYSPCKDCVIECDEEKKKVSLDMFRKYADLILVHAPDMFEYLPDGKFIPASIDTNYWQSNKTNTPGVFKIFHPFGNAKTRGNAKGTREVLYAVNRLIKEGEKVELIQSDKVTNRELKPYYEESNIVVEQLRSGTHGITAIEAMSLGKPVIAYIRPNFVKAYTGLPIINANPDNIYQKLKWAVNHQNELEKLGKKSREYAVRTHDSATVAKKIYQLYKSLY